MYRKEKLESEGHFEIDVNGETLRWADDIGDDHWRDFGKDVGFESYYIEEEKDRLIKEEGYSPVFTFDSSKLTVEDIIKNGGIKPSDPGVVVSGKLMVGTIARAPIEVSAGESGFHVVIINKELRSDVKPKMSGKKDAPMYTGAIVLEKSIPLSDIIIIDDATGEILYSPEGVNAINKNLMSSDPGSDSGSAIDTSSTKESIDETLDK